MSGTNFNANIPQGGQFLNAAGSPSQAWSYFFLQLLNRTGGTAGIGVGDVNSLAQEAQAAAASAASAAAAAEAAANSAGAAVSAETARAEGAEAGLQSQILPGQLPATNANDNAAAGKLGEILVATAGSPVALTSGSPANVVSLALTPGDWDVDGQIVLSGGGTTTLSSATGSLSSSSGTIQNGLLQSSVNWFEGGTVFASISPTIELGPWRVSLGGNSTIYLVVQASFGVSTANAGGGLRARRAR